MAVTAVHHQSRSARFGQNHWWCYRRQLDGDGWVQSDSGIPLQAVSIYCSL